MEKDTIQRWDGEKAILELPEAQDPEEMLENGVWR